MSSLFYTEWFFQFSSCSQDTTNSIVYLFSVSYSSVFSILFALGSGFLVIGISMVVF